MTISKTGPWAQIRLTPTRNLFSSFVKESSQHGTIIQDYFSAESYKKVMGEKKAKIVTIIAMFYDLSNPEVFLEDLSTVMDDDGLLENSIIIAKGEKLPVARTRTYYTVEDDQRVLTCEVTQSAIPESDPTLVLRIAEVEMPLPPGRPADQPIEVTFAYDLNGIMRAEFRDLGTGKPLVIELRDEGAGRGSLNVAQVTLG